MTTQPQHATLALLSRADLLEPAVIRAAATVGLADHLGDGATGEEVADRAGTDADVTVALLGELEELGLVVSDAEGRFRLTESGDPLRTDHPMSARPMLRNDSAVGVGGLSLLRLDHTVRTRQPAMAADGRGYWDVVNHDPAHRADVEQQAADAAAMAAAGHPLQWDADRIVTEYDWSDVGHVVDVGGNVGSVLLALVQEHPHLSGTLLDLGHAAAVARSRFRASAQADRLDVVEGSFFDPLPAGGDVYLLSAILADWSDEDAVRILERCRQAAGPTSGRVLLAEVAMPMDSPATRLRMWSMMPSPARSVDELVVLADKAGLDTTWVGDRRGARSLLELTVR